MTEQEYITKHTKYSKKAEYYRRKLLRLEAEYFEQINKDNKFLKCLCGKGEPNDNTRED